MKQVYLVVVAVISIGFKQGSGALSPAFNKQYDDKVCNNEPTCPLTLTPDLDTKRLTLDGRDCMCDFECAEYNDCCKDSQYFKAPALSSDRKVYTCHPTFKVYMVADCPASYKDEKIKTKCSKALQPLEELDTVIITPVTNKNKRITYASAYCALCHGDTDFELWTLGSGCGEPIAARRSKRDAPKVRVNFSKYNNKLDKILPTVTYNTDKKQFTATYEGKELICEFSAKLPATLTSYTRRCLPDMVAECAANPEGTKKCQSHIAIVYDKRTKKPYRNRDCALCNGVPADQLSGCPVGVRTGASTLFSGGTKSAGSDACSNPVLREKFC